MNKNRISLALYAFVLIISIIFFTQVYAIMENKVEKISIKSANSYEQLLNEMK